MIAVFVLIIGVMLVLLIGAVVLALTNTADVLSWLVPFAPMLVTIGTFLIILTELLLFLGSKEDRKTAARDLAYLVPTFVVSLGLWWIAQRFLL